MIWEANKMNTIKVTYCKVFHYKRANLNKNTVRKHLDQNEEIEV